MGEQKPHSGPHKFAGDHHCHYCGEYAPDACAKLEAENAKLREVAQALIDECFVYYPQEMLNLKNELEKPCE